jgi:hypothetical protein
MGRSTFSGPILSGEQRFGSQRNVGTVELVQNAFLDFAVTAPGTTNYGGGSSVFVSPNNIPNNIGTIWNPQSGSYSTNGPTTATAPTADATGTNYRGAVFLLPYGSNIIDVIVDQGTTPTDGSHAATAVNVFISNTFATAAGVYATMASITGAGRTNATYTATQLDNANGTLQDVQNIQPGQQPTWFSQVVVTLQILAGSLTSVNAGQMNITLRYTQADGNIGSSSTYPYGNFD